MKYYYLRRFDDPIIIIFFLNSSLIFWQNITIIISYFETLSRIVRHGRRLTILHNIRSSQRVKLICDCKKSPEPEGGGVRFVGKSALSPTVICSKLISSEMKRSERKPSTVSYSNKGRSLFLIDSQDRLGFEFSVPG